MDERRSWFSAMLFHTHLSLLGTCVSQDPLHLALGCIPARQDKSVGLLGDLEKEQVISVSSALSVRMGKISINDLDQ